MASPFFPWAEEYQESRANTHRAPWGCVLPKSNRLHLFENEVKAKGDGSVSQVLAVPAWESPNTNTRGWYGSRCLLEAEPSRSPEMGEYMYVVHIHHAHMRTHSLFKQKKKWSQILHGKVKIWRCITSVGNNTQCENKGKAIKPYLGYGCKYTVKRKTEVMVLWRITVVGGGFASEKLSYLSFPLL